MEENNWKEREGEFRTLDGQDLSCRMDFKTRKG